MSEYNPIFGCEIREAYPTEQEQIDGLVEAVPLAVFQALNKKLNKNGICISFQKLPDKGE